MTQVVTTYTKDGDGEVTGVSSSISNTDPSSCKVCHRPANCNLEFDNMGSDTLLGSANGGWDMSTGNHSKGIRCVKDRISYDQRPQLVGIAPGESGFCVGEPCW